MRCPECGLENRSGASFCAACGASLSAEEPGDTGTCPTCGAQVPSDAPFCPECGAACAPLTPTQPIEAGMAPATQPPPPKRSKSGCTWALVAGAVLVVLLCLIVAVIGVVLVATGTLAPASLISGPPATATAVLPQACGLAEDSAGYGPVEVGTVVVLGRHREVDGDDNWSDDMDAYVGQETAVTRLSGVDGQGCPGVRVDADGGQWFWRLRDLSLP